MELSRPILGEIKERFDTYPHLPELDHTMISGVAIAPKPQGYRITAYPGGVHCLHDGFALDLTVPGGMFGAEAPTSVETSVDHGGLLILSPGPITEDETGRRTIHGALDTFPASEGLVLPEDDGFELFTKLHKKMRGLHAPLREAVQIIGEDFDPQAFAFTEYAGATVSDRNNPTTIRHHSTTYDITNNTHTAKLVFHGMAEAPWHNRWDTSGVTYNSGVRLYGNAECELLSPETLLAFGAFRSIVEELYKAGKAPLDDGAISFPDIL